MTPVFTSGNYTAISSDWAHAWCGSWFLCFNWLFCLRGPMPTPSHAPWGAHMSSKGDLIKSLCSFNRQGLNTRGLVGEKRHAKYRDGDLMAIIYSCVYIPIHQVAHSHVNGHLSLTHTLEHTHPHTHENKHRLVNSPATKSLAVCCCLRECTVF